jgi:DNA-binding MarR family transcriptional regulator
MAIDDMYTVAMISDETATGRLLWQVTMKWRTAGDRALSPLGLTHIQYVILASLYGLSLRGARPSQRELAESAGLEPVYASKIIRALEQAGLLSRTEDPADSRAVQLTLTDHGAQLTAKAIAIIGQLYEELTASIGGTSGAQNRGLVRTLRSLLGSPSTNQARGANMTQATPALLSPQDIAEAEGALRELLARALEGSGITGTEFVVMRVVTGRGPWASLTALQDYLGSQPQLDLGHESAGELISTMISKGLLNDQATLTAEGAATFAKLGEKIRPGAIQVFGGIDPNDLAVAHRVLTQVIERANAVTSAH